jgi:hypothetical protein
MAPSALACQIALDGIAQNLAHGHIAGFGLSPQTVTQVVRCPEGNDGVHLARFLQ